MDSGTRAVVASARGRARSWVAQRQAPRVSSRRGAVPFARLHALTARDEWPRERIDDVVPRLPRRGLARRPGLASSLGGHECSVDPGVVDVSGRRLERPMSQFCGNEPVGHAVPRRRRRIPASERVTCVGPGVEPRRCRQALDDERHGPRTHPVPADAATSPQPPKDRPRCQPCARQPGPEEGDGVGGGVVPV
jgi:hypothetical protein